jgi:hypothetical protein
MLPCKFHVRRPRFEATHLINQHDHQICGPFTPNADECENAGEHGYSAVSDDYYRIRCLERCSDHEEDRECHTRDAQHRREYADECGGRLGRMSTSPAPTPHSYRHMRVTTAIVFTVGFIELV